ncbi:phosphatidylcholine synthase [Roseiconus nitratireducens]|uniref:Phosphatidylcholine synthase n=1 Tax=Roseiconus nitratireducens TaxID=2605748 RepID=A0A5M6D528_9BACT|nr:CDP-alcohol phosphatidyltransferase family protein [Roseiconus nitratireducens]KAA5542594.1 phosphatidylcholine synthase [Roseiconus nitratireducens]
MPSSPALRVKAYAVHLLTASGIVPAALAMNEVARPDGDPRMVFLWLLVCTIIDAVDGPLARRYHVKTNAPAVDGRTIDDLLDYLTFAFIPLMLVWRMGWLPHGTGWTVSLAMAASLFGFSHTQAKDESGGFFRGFPSYWNIFAFYAGLISTLASPWASAVLMWILTILTVTPVKFLYPNLTPRRWKPWILYGSVLWVVVMLWMLPRYPNVSPVTFVVSLIYPAFYTIVSFKLASRGKTTDDGG